MSKRFLVLAAAVLALGFQVPQAGAQAPKRDSAEVLRGFDETVAKHIYDPRPLQSADYREFRRRFGERAAGAASDAEVIAAFRASWKGKPFSHFDLRLSSKTAAATTLALKQEGAGERNAILTYPAEGVALLEVKTFLGDEVGRQLHEALTAVRQSGAGTLIVDLRDNPGGSIAAVVLIQGLLKQTEKVGYFVNNVWWRTHAAAPSAAEIEAMEPLMAADPEAFAKDLADGVAVVQLPPGAPRFDGRVFVLTSRRTASIAEMTSAALKGAKAATLVGETTAGKMLSGEFADAGGGFQVFMPMADYYSLPLGRIEGVGIKPDIAVPADQALETALRLARDSQPAVAG